MHEAVVRPTALRRLAAITSMVIVVGVLAEVVERSLGRVGALLAVAALVVLLVLTVWLALTRARTVRAIAVALVGAVVATLVAIFIAGSLVAMLVAIVLLAISVALGRYALARDLRTLKRTVTVGTPAPPAQRGALILNPKSGGGKAERFHLVEECQHRGIEPIVLQPGGDLVALTHDAIDRGADVIGMAGGDGSQALVAAVAAQRGVPMVVVPAGTRNHLALDLGVDRDDVVGALDAYGNAVERPMDLGEVNGRAFVNNVSLGIYASIVESPEYRDAKVSTVLAALPKMLGPDTAPMDLRYDDAGGGHHDGAHMIQVSNGAYGQTMRTMGSRPNLADGLLGVIALVLPDDAAAYRFLAALGSGHPEGYAGYQSWTTPSFVIDSGAPVAIGLDGETMQLEPPLQFRVRPAALRVRLAPSAIGFSPGARLLQVRDVLPHLWRVAWGRPSAPVTARGLP